MGMSFSRVGLLSAAVALGLVWSAGGDAPSPVSAQTLAETDRPAVTSDPVDGYMALAPSVLRSGQTESISVSLFAGQQPARGTVRLELLDRGVPVAEATGSIEGTGAIPLSVPDIRQGHYQLSVQGPGFHETTSLRVESGDVLFVETDKPIYKPGQDMHIRVLLLDIELKPMSRERHRRGTGREGHQGLPGSCGVGRVWDGESDDAPIDRAQLRRLEDRCVVRGPGRRNGSPC